MVKKHHLITPFFNINSLEDLYSMILRVFEIFKNIDFEMHRPGKLFQLGDNNF